MTSWDGEDYQRRFDELAAGGTDVHGEATFVAALAPRAVLDAGCGTGRVAIELHRRGIDVIGVDGDGSMIDAARRRAPALTWVHADMTEVDLGRRFDVVVMAGNVPLFTPPGTTAALVAGCASHLDRDGVLVTGFTVDHRYPLERYDAEAAAVGLTLVERFSTWDRRPFEIGGDYAVSVHLKSAA